MFYVYEWYIVETNEIIYVGKGCRNRYKVRKHNKFFNEMIKMFNCESRIIKHFEKEKEAFQYEYERIKELKSTNQCKCNIYNGGFGGSTSDWNDEKRERYSKFNVMKNKNQRERMSKYNPMKNKEVAKKVGKKLKRKICVGNEIFDGIVDVSKKYNVCKSSIGYWLERGYTRDLKPCYYYGKEPKNFKIKNNGKPIIVNGIKYKSLTQAGKAIGVSESILSILTKDNKFPYKYKNFIIELDKGNQQVSQENVNEKSILETSTTNE